MTMPHNPKNVNENQLPTGYRFATSDEVENSLLRDALIWVRDTTSWGLPSLGECFSGISESTYAIPNWCPPSPSVLTDVTKVLFTPGEIRIFTQSRGHDPITVKLAK
jgi:hypothetical protein